MINESLYLKSKSILIDSYYNDTLEHGDFCSCAIGNLIASARGETIIEKFVRKIDDSYIKYPRRRLGYLSGYTPKWNEVFCYNGEREQFLHEENYKEDAKNEIDSTGYTVKELMKIEMAFETSNQGETKEDFTYNGLISVLQTLDQIHSVDSPTEMPSKKI